MPNQRRLQQVTRLLSKWKPRLLLTKWAVIPELESEDCTANKDGSVDMACIQSDAAQSEARITIYPRLWRESREFQEITLIHELAHIHTEPIRELLQKGARAGTIDKKAAKDALEDLTNTVAKLVYAAYRGRKKSSSYHV